MSSRVKFRWDGWHGAVRTGQTGLPLQAEERGFFRGGPPKVEPMKWVMEEERPWEGPKQERPPLTQSI